MTAIQVVCSIKVSFATWQAERAPSLALASVLSKGATKTNAARHESKSGPGYSTRQKSILLSTVCVLCSGWENGGRKTDLTVSYGWHVRSCADVIVWQKINKSINRRLMHTSLQQQCEQWLNVVTDFFSLAMFVCFRMNLSLLHRAPISQTGRINKQSRVDCFLIKETRTGMGVGKRMRY